MKDDSKADDEEIKSIKEVLSLVKKGGQYQLVIGNNVDRVYNDLAKVIGIGSGDNGKKNDDRLVLIKLSAQLLDR